MGICGAQSAAQISASFITQRAEVFFFFLWLPEGCFNFPLHTVRHMYDITGGKKWSRSEGEAKNCLAVYCLVFPLLFIPHLLYLNISAPYSHLEPEAMQNKTKLQRQTHCTVAEDIFLSVFSVSSRSPESLETLGNIQHACMLKRERMHTHTHTEERQPSKHTSWLSQMKNEGC